MESCHGRKDSAKPLSRLQTGHIDEELMWLDTRVKELLKEQASSKESGAGRE